VQSPDGQIKLPLLEPVSGKRRSQVDEYLEYHGGPGVQHAALLSEDIIRTVADLRSSGVEFMSTPWSYYEMLTNRIGDVEEDVSALRDLNILVDRDAWGYLMQIFSKPLQSRPTFFVEVIQRKGARGFGSGNIKALFEAVEREQARRGNL
jgi:4-hydroxyphenylpyruvate dioxygenase